MKRTVEASCYLEMKLIGHNLSGNAVSLKWMRLKWGEIFFFDSMTVEGSRKKGAYIVDNVIMNTRQSSSLMRKCICNS